MVATSAPREAVAVEGEVTWYASSACSARATGFAALTYVWDWSGTDLSVLAGTLDGDLGLVLAGHIFCADKSCYYEISDGLPQASKDSPTLTMPDSKVIPLA